MATNDELLKIWAQQNGSDYNVLAGAQNGGGTGNSQNAQSYTVPASQPSTQNTANDLYSEYGWNSGTLPGTNIPTSQASQTTPAPAQSVTPAATQETVSRPSGTHTVASTAASSGASGTSVQDYINYYTSRGITQPPMSYEEWVAWMLRGGGSAAPTGSTGSGASQPASSAQPTGGSTAATNPYPYMQDYIDYYTAIGQQPDKSYDEWVSWRNSGGTQQTTTPTGTGGTGTTPTTTPTTTPSAEPTPTTPTQTTGTSPQDYINYYTSRGITQPPIGYEAWVQMMQGGGEQQGEAQSGGDTGGTAGGQTGTGTGTGTTEGQTQGTSVQDYITYWTSRGVTTPPMGYDEWVTFITNGGGTGTPGSTGTGGTGTSGGNVTHNYPTVDMDNRQRISDMYDAQINAQRAALQEQGDQALSDAQANRDKIASLYNKQRNAASVDWERQRRNFLEGAATSGINTGAGSQAELSMMSAYQRSQNDLGAAQAQAEAEADRNIADIKRSTQASISEAIAKNDYQKAAALLDEYNAQYNRAMDRAEALAQYGDFSGYAALYGDEAAAQMRYTWIMSNPEIALAMGQITQQQYAALTLYKQYPALALTGGSGGGSSGGDGGGYNPVSGIANVFNNHSDEIIQGIIDREMSVIAGATNNG